MLPGNPGAQEGGGLHHPCLDYTGKLAGRPAATGFTGPGPVEGTHTHTVHFFHSILFINGKIITANMVLCPIFVTSYFSGQSEFFLFGQGLSCHHGVRFNNNIVHSHTCC